MATDPTGRISHIADMHRGLTWKPACRAATTASITISTALNNGDTLDGITLATGDRVLVKNQSTASQNGIYIVGATPTRAADMDQDTTTSVPAEEIAGAVVFVISGTVNTKTIWYTTNAVGGTVGSTSIVWAQFSSGTSPSGSITASGYTESTATLLGRTTAGTGAIEEISVGSGLSLSAGSLTATGGGGATPLGAGTIVNTKTYASFTSGVAITLGFTPTNGNILLAYITTNTGQPSAITTTNVTWTRAVRSAYFTGNQQLTDIWIGVVSGSPGNTATITVTGPLNQGAAFEEFSGLSTVDSAEAWMNRITNSTFQEAYHAFPWPTPGGRVICLFGNSQGGAIAVPTGWTRNIAAGSYGGSASASILTIDASATATYARSIFVDPVANDVHLGCFVHLIP